MLLLILPSHFKLINMCLSPRLHLGLSILWLLLGWFKCLRRLGERGLSILLLLHHLEGNWISMPKGKKFLSSILWGDKNKLIFWKVKVLNMCSSLQEIGFKSTKNSLKIMDLMLYLMPLEEDLSLIILFLILFLELFTWCMVFLKANNSQFRIQ